MMRILSNPNNNNKGRFSSDDDGDEDYVFNEDDGDDSDFPKGFLVSSSDDDEQPSLQIQNKKKKRKPPLSSKSSKTNTRVKKMRGRQVSDDDAEEDYDFDEPDTDDDEFNPDYNDEEEEEEEEDLHLHTRASLTKKKNRNNKQQNSNKRKRKTVLHEKDSITSKKLKTNSKLLKSTKLLPGTSSDDDFDLDYTSKTKCTRRNKSPVEDSDQEEELLREANNFIHNSITRPRNSSLFNRRLHVSGPSIYHPPKPKTRSKKKQETQKVTTLQGDTSKQVCGICFSEEGKGIVRGSLNCCSHYFCFACIMEWSKVESRCPLCKQRFVAISKPARSYFGVDLRSMVIQVPKRDQVYQPSEEELRDFLDPYDGVVCMECQLGGDDCLMLLCDICDSPAHTYCVGLGREVPEGNWYCKGCRISEPGPSNAQVQDLSQGTSTSSIPTYLYGHRTNLDDSDPIPQSTISVSESMNEIGVHLSPRHSVADDGHLASPSGLGVSTLSGRRRIHRRIRNLISSNRMSQRFEMATQTEEGNVESEAVPIEVEQIGKPNTQHEASSGFNCFVYDFWTQDGNPSSV